MTFVLCHIQNNEMLVNEPDFVLKISKQIIIWTQNEILVNEPDFVLKISKQIIMASFYLSLLTTYLFPFIINISYFKLIKEGEE